MSACGLLPGGLDEAIGVGDQHVGADRVAVLEDQLLDLGRSQGGVDALGQGGELEYGRGTFTAPSVARYVTQP